MTTTPTTQAQNGAELDLDKLTRFDLVPGEAGRMVIGQEDEGSYVSYHEVKEALARRAAAPHAGAEPTQWTLQDALDSVRRAQAFPGWERLPQPVRVQIDNAEHMLAKLVAAAHAGSEAPTGAEHRGCTSCEWEGETDRMCGSVGPLCPSCGDTTEVIQRAAVHADIGAKMPCGAVVTNVYEAYAAGQRAAAPTEAPAAFAKRYTELLRENRRLKKEARALVADVEAGITNGDAARDLSALLDGMGDDEGEVSQRAAAPVSGGAIESIASNHDAMIILTQSYPAASVISVVDAWVKRQLGRAAVAAAKVPTSGLAEAVAAMNRAKKLPVWDDINHALHIELDTIFKALSSAAPVEQGQGAATAQPVELAGVREQIKEGAGFWRACSGCYDTEDGHPTQHYAYSHALGCALGNGCSECGGIGAMWDNTDYEAMAKDWDKDESAPPERAAAPTEAETQAEEARLYRDLTGDVMALGFDGLVAAVEALRQRAAAPADSLVHRIVDSVMVNLEDRKGVFEDIDDEIMQEIRDDLGNTIRKAIATQQPSAQENSHE